MQIQPIEQIADSHHAARADHVFDVESHNVNETIDNLGYYLLFYFKMTILNGHNKMPYDHEEEN